MEGIVKVNRGVSNGRDHCTMFYTRQITSWNDYKAALLVGGLVGGTRWSYYSLLKLQV